MDTLRIGIAQIDPALGDLRRNGEKHLAFIEEARSKNVKLLVFPELSLTGYALKTSLIDVALARDSPTILELAEAAGDMHVCVGFVEEGEAAQFYNSCIIVHRGRPVYVHRKLNLATYGTLEEGKYFGTGRWVESCQLSPSWRASILICADMWNPALPYLTILHGVTILLVPTNSAHASVSSEFSNQTGWDLVTRYPAMIYGMPVVFANRVGQEEDLEFWGKSQVIDPFGDTVVVGNETNEELLVAEVDYAAVRKARYQLPTVRDSNLELVRREINRVGDYSGIPPERKTT